MNLTTVFWILCIALVVASLVMAVGLVAIVVDIIDRVQRMRNRRATQN